MSASRFNTNRGSPINRPEHNWSGISQGADMVSTIAYVIRDILPNEPGRIHYLATDWNALSVNNTHIPTGTKVRPIMRRGNTWYVAADAEAHTQQAA